VPRVATDRLARAADRPTAPHLAHAAVAPTASPTTSSSRPKPRRSDRRPGRLAARPSPSHRAAIPASMSRRFLGRLPSAGVVPSWASPRLRRPCQVGLAREPRLRGHGPCARVAAGRAHTVRLGRARFRPSGTWLNFYYFMIYSIHCKFKNLCRIQFNSENYETNFVGKV
jgi:hypothetical protein